MATASEIALQALREGNLVDLQTGLTAAEQSEALLLLNRFLESLLGFELGEFAFDWPLPPATTSPVDARFPLYPRSEDLRSNVFPYPAGNVRILMRLTTSTTIYLPQRPNDGARVLFVDLAGEATLTLTVDGNGRLVKGSDTITETPASLNSQLLFYRADLGDWTGVTTLDADSVSPLPTLYDDLLAMGLFIRMAPRYGRTVPAETALAYRRLLKRLKTQYRQPTPSPSANPQPFPHPASEGYRNGWGHGSGF